MIDEQRNPPQRGGDANPKTGVNQTAGSGPGGGEAGIGWILALAFYLVLFTLFVIYSLVKIWPVPTPSREPAPAAASPSPTATPTPTPNATNTPTPSTSSTPLRAVGVGGQAAATPSPTPKPSPSPATQPSPVTILGYTFFLWDEQILLLLVILGGALGSLVHCLRSVYWYVGNRSLIKSWIAMYLMMPFAGAALALVFYLLIRGGFFSPTATFEQTSPFGFSAFAALIGMFSTQAVLKLKDVAEVLLAKPQSGANAKPQESVTPSPGGGATAPPAAPGAGGKTG